MKPISEAILLEDPVQLYAEYHAREELSHQMVGSLYPSILADEMGRLVERCIELSGYHPNWHRDGDYRLRGAK